MGGGDLNLKKSWHPSTMRNMEKVWKAEQQDNQEKKRIAELKREIAMERDREEMKAFAMEQGVIEKKEDKKLDWMYKGPNENINREEYLLGRPIDKQFDQMVQAEKEVEQNKPVKNHVEHECIPPSLRFFSGNEQVDLARKLQEDPLYAIKKKEMETREQLLKNPVKLKQLRQLVEQQTRKSKDDKKKKKKKKKAASSSEESDTDKKLDDLLAAKYKMLKGDINEKDLIKSVKKHKKSKKSKKSKKKDSSDSDDSEDSESDSGSDESVKHKSKKGKKKTNDGKYESKKSDYKSNSDKRRSEEKSSSKRKNSDNYDKHYDAKHKRRKERSPERSSERRRERSTERKPERHRHHSHSEDESPKHKSRGYGLMNADGSRVSPIRKHSSSRNDYKSEAKPIKKEQKWIPPKKQKLTEEEKERRRQEMMENALIRDKERKLDVKRYESQEKRESMKETVDNEKFKGYLQKQLSNAVENESVASRIKSNINNIQRFNHSMDKNFAKR